MSDSWDLVEWGAAWRGACSRLTIGGRRGRRSSERKPATASVIGMLAEPRCLICSGVIGIPAAAMFDFCDFRHAGYA